MHLAFETKYGEAVRRQFRIKDRRRGWRFDRTDWAKGDNLRIRTRCWMKTSEKRSQKFRNFRIWRLWKFMTHSSPMNLESRESNDSTKIRVVASRRSQFLQRSEGLSTDGHFRALLRAVSIRKGKACPCWLYKWLLRKKNRCLGNRGKPCRSIGSSPNTISAHPATPTLGALALYYSPVCLTLAA